MTKILLRSSKDPFAVASPAATAAEVATGTNLGNLLFAQSIHRMLLAPGIEIIPNSLRNPRPEQIAGYAARINEQFDVLALPLANAFRPDWAAEMEMFAGLIERLDIPVVVIGVGAQFEIDGTGVPREMDDVARRFVKAVLKRSTSIGVRGEMTADYLAGLGFRAPDVDVIGCPSLFFNGPGLQVGKRVEALEANSRIALNVSPWVPEMAQVVAHHVDAYPALEYMGQHRDDLMLALWGQNVDPVGDLRMPVHDGHRLYREDRIRCFTDPAVWIDYLSEFDFAFGTRIHGNVAAVLAGTPAMVLACDSRTLELARYHEIPYRDIYRLQPDADAAELYELTDYAAFNAGQPERFAHFAEFLEHNGLAHAYGPGADGGARFDERLSATAFPGPIHTVHGEDPVVRDQIIAQMRWLGDRVRPAATRRVEYVPPFQPAPKPPFDVRLAKLEGRIADQDTRLRELVQRADRQRARLARQGRRLSRQRAQIEEQRAAIARQRTKIVRQQNRIKRLARRLDAAGSRTLSARIRGAVRRLRPRAR